MSIFDVPVSDTHKYQSNPILEVTIECNSEEEGWYNIVEIKGDNKRLCCDKSPEDCRCALEKMILSEVEQLNDFISDVGVEGLWGDGEPPPTKAKKFKLTGKMWFEEYHGYEGTDYDSGFNIEKVEDLG